MKKILFFILIVISIQSFGQPTGYQVRKVNERLQGKFMVDSAFNIPRYYDTTAANLHKGVDTCGAMFFAYGKDSIYYRACNPKRWISIGSGSGATLKYNESIVKSNDSVYFEDEKLYPRRRYTGIVDSAGFSGWHDMAIVDLSAAFHGDELWYDSTGTYENGRGVIKTREQIPSCIPTYLVFTVGVEVNAPAAGDSLLTHTGFDEKVVTYFRDGHQQNVNSLSGYTLSGTSMYSHPPYFANEQVFIKLEDSACATQLTLEVPVEGAPSDMDFDVTGSGTVIESPSGTWTYSAGAYAGNTLTALTGNGYFQCQMPGDALVIGLDDNSSPDFWNGGGSTAEWSYEFFVSSGTMYILQAGTSTGAPTSIGSVGSNTHIRMRRSGTTVLLQVSTDGTNFTTAHTYGATTAVPLFVKTNRAGSGNTIINPKTYGFE